MDLKFSIHNIFNIVLRDVPKNIKIFLEGELDYFKVKKLLKIDLEIEFVKKIDLPENRYELLKDLSYKNGILYFRFFQSILSFPIKDLHKNKINVKSEKNIPELMIFYLIEKVMLLKILEKKYCFFHASCVYDDEKIRIFSALSGVGKTKLLLEKLANGAGFISDDLVLVSRSCIAYCYPRRFNINKYHGKYFDVSKIIRERIRDFILLFSNYLISDNLLFHTKEGYYSAYNLKQKIKEQQDKKRLLRLNVKDIFPNVKIVDNAKIDDINILIKSDKQKFQKEIWKSERVINFLIKNIRHEMLAFVYPYLDAFWAFGDEYGVESKKYITKLLEKEKNTVTKIVENCHVNIIYLKE